MSTATLGETKVKTHEVGDRALTELYQFLDPLRGKVPPSERVDLNKHPKHDGGVTFLPMPDAWTAPPEFADFMGPGDMWEDFHTLTKMYGIHSLAYSMDTARTFLQLLDFPDGETLVWKLALELYPTAENIFLGRAHGKQGTYTSGCRGPLCKNENTQKQRVRYNRKPPGVSRSVQEAALNQIAASYNMYIEYVRQIMNFRRSLENQDDVAYRHWSGLNLPMSVLIDATDESFAL